jgi:hypothetical protein
MKIQKFSIFFIFHFLIFGKNEFLKKKSGIKEFKNFKKNRYKY